MFAGKKCAICGKEPTLKYQPFCSKRCADVDLGKWLNGNYAVAANEEPDLEEVDEEL